MSARDNQQATILQWYRDGLYEQLFEAFRAQASLDPSPQLCELAGLAAIKTGQLSLAEQCFRRLIDLRHSPRDAFHLATSLAHAGRWREAIGYFQASEKEKALKPAAVFGRAECLWRLRQWTEALRVIRAMPAPRPMPAHLLEITILLDAGQKEEALRLFSDLPAAPKQQPDAQQLYARLLFANEQWAELDCHISGTWPDSSARPLLVANIAAAALLKQGEIDEAIEHYRVLQHQNPDSYRQRYNLAAALSNHTDPEKLQEAIGLCRQCVQERPDDPQPVYTVALCQRKLGRLEQAREALQPLVAQHPHRGDFREVLATTLSDLGQHDKALAYLQDVPEDMPQTASYVRQTGIILARRGDFPAAEQKLLQAVLLDDRDQRSLAYLGLSRLALGKKSLVEEFLGLGRLVQQMDLHPDDRWPDGASFNRQLAEDIRGHSRLRLNPRGLAARNGYLTSELLADRTRAILAFDVMLRQAIERYIRQLPDDPAHPMLKHKAAVLAGGYTLNLWATWVKGDGYIDKHIHEDSWISGAYYVALPEVVKNTDTHAGYFEYGCVPDDLCIETDAPRGFVRPEVGRLVIFPSYLYHQTIPHGSMDDRISIAFDLTPTQWRGGV